MEVPLDAWDELRWVRSQLDSLAMKRMNIGFTIDDRENYCALCLREQELLALLAA